MKKIKHNKAVEPDSEDGAAVLLLAGLGLGLWAWVGARKAKDAAALAARRFRQMPKVNPNRSPATKLQKEVSQMWSPEFSHLWRH